MKKPYTQKNVWSNRGKKTQLKRKKFSKVRIWSDRVKSMFVWEKKSNHSKPHNSHKLITNTPGYSRSLDKSEVTMRVLKPKKDYFVKQAIQKITPEKKKRKLNWGQKDFNQLQQRVKTFSLNNLIQNLNLHIHNLGIRENFSMFFAKFCIVFMAFSVVYLSFLDTYFLIDTYKVEYKNNSFLDENDSRELLNHLKSNRVLGVFPNNQLWFINDQNLTLTAAGYSDQIDQIKVTERTWPNIATLEVTTKPILMTLLLNDNEYWRVGRDGSVVTEDTAILNDRVVTVQFPTNFDRTAVTLADYPLQTNTPQLNRMYFTEWLWGVLRENNIEVVNTEFPSLIDTDVIITTDKNIEMRFNSESIRKDLQQARIEGFFKNQELKREYDQAVIKYVDFRLSKKIYVCYREKFCANY
jgi:hypothetical protein